MLVFDGTRKVGLRAEMVGDRGVVTLPGRHHDLPVRHRRDSVLGEQPFGCRQDRFPSVVGSLGSDTAGLDGHRPKSTLPLVLSQTFYLNKLRPRPHPGRTVSDGKVVVITPLVKLNGGAVDCPRWHLAERVVTIDADAYQQHASAGEHGPNVPSPTRSTRIWTPSRLSRKA